jgi:hypothetical protein
MPVPPGFMAQLGTVKIVKTDGPTPDIDSINDDDLSALTLTQARLVTALDDPVSRPGPLPMQLSCEDGRTQMGMTWKVFASMRCAFGGQAAPSIFSTKALSQTLVQSTAPARMPSGESRKSRATMAVRISSSIQPARSAPKSSGTLVRSCARRRRWQKPIRSMRSNYSNTFGPFRSRRTSSVKKYHRSARKKVNTTNVTPDGVSVWRRNRVGSQNSFEVARDIIKGVNPLHVYAYRDGCTFLTNEVPSTPVTRQLERYFDIRDREPRQTTDGYIYRPPGKQITIAFPSIEAIQPKTAEKSAG